MYPSWWNSLETVTKVYDGARVVTIVLAAACAAAIYITSNRITTLKGDRHLTPEQKAAFLTSLKQHSAVEVRLTCEDGESCVYANEFLELFRKARWPIVGNGVTGVEAGKPN